MSAKFYSDDEGENEEDLPIEGTISFGGRNSVIFAIDCCKEMFSKDSDEEAPFNRIISAIHDMFLNRIITSDKDVHAIVLFGTGENKNSSDFSNIFVWQKLDVPCVRSITDLRNMQTIDESTFSKDFGNNSDYQINNVLWECLNMFSGSTHKLATKTLILLTWDDNPHHGDGDARKRAKAKAGDLHDHGVDVQVLSFNKKFDYQRFYKDIVSDPGSEEPFVENPIDSICNLYSFLLRKCSKQRPLARIPMRLGNEIEISVGVYTVARRVTKSAAAKTDAKTNQEAKRVTNFVDSNTAEILMPSDIKLTQKWAGRDAVFEKEEVQDMKKLAKQGLTLLGFKPRSQAVKAKYHVRNSQFIYPNEATIKGSTNLFNALLIKCLEKDVVAICSYSMRATTPPRYVALLPQQEEVDPETEEQIKFPGFYIIFLPFADDIREVNVERDLQKPSKEQVEAAEALIRRLRFAYDPENFDNPVIQTHYKNLEAMALDKEQAEEVEDYTQPNVEQIEKKAGSLIKTFKELVFPPDYNPGKKTTKHKASDSAGSSAKRPKDVEVDVKEYIAEKRLGKLTVQGLKEICRSYDIRSTGRKADIIKAIEDHFKLSS